MTTKLITVAELDQLPPGARRLCTVGDRRIALFNLDGTIYAIDNHCTHRDGPVAAGQLTDTVITCPWHGWRFNVATGRCLEPEGENLRQYPVSVEGNDVRIDIAATPSPEKSDGIYCCLVRYGVLGHVNRVGSNRSIPCRRGDRVIVHTDRGLEVAEVVEAPSSVAGNSSQKKPTGELLRVMSDEDHRQLQRLDSAHQTALRRCQELVAESNLPIIAVDAELLFDGQTIIVYFLGEPTDKLGPIAVELSKAAGNRRVQFQRIESLQATETISKQPADQKPKRSKQEQIKESSNFLRGTIMDELTRDSDKFTPDDVSLLKFHGTYQQDDRDSRKSREPDAGIAGKQHIFMVRLKIPGGRMTAGQLLDTLDLSDRFANGTPRITTRQGLQLHGVVKANLWQAIHDINESLLTTLGACGDVVRNVMCCPAPLRNDRVRNQMQSTASDLARHCAPRTSAYFDIWIDGEKPATRARPASDGNVESESGPSLASRAGVNDVEPFYGATYLPRKFKIGIALPEDNCIDVCTQDVGLLAVVESDQLVGYNVLVGGGLGNTPSVKETFPRLADPLAFVPYADVLTVVTAIVQVQRDHGNRENRRRARMKYLVDEWGVKRFKEKVEEQLAGKELAEPRAVRVRGIDDHLEESPQTDMGRR